jgi:hypothetical protein
LTQPLEPVEEGCLVLWAGIRADILICRVRKVGGVVWIKDRDQIEVETSTMGYIWARRIRSVVGEPAEIIGMGKKESNLAMIMLTRWRNSRKAMTFGE